MHAQDVSRIIQFLIPEKIAIQDRLTGDSAALVRTQLSNGWRMIETSGKWNTSFSYFEPAETGAEAVDNLIKFPIDQRVTSAMSKMDTSDGGWFVDLIFAMDLTTLDATDLVMSRVPESLLGRIRAEHLTWA